MAEDGLRFLGVCDVEQVADVAPHDRRREPDFILAAELDRIPSQMLSQDMERLAEGPAGGGIGGFRPEYAVDAIPAYKGVAPLDCQVNEQGKNARTAQDGVNRKAAVQAEIGARERADVDHYCPLIAQIRARQLPDTIFSRQSCRGKHPDRSGPNAWGYAMIRTLRCELLPCEWRDACHWLCQQGLSTQERRVALLMAYRRTNKEMAMAMGKSVRTAEHHVAGALAKLMVRRQQVWGALAATAARAPRTAPRCMSADVFHSPKWYPPLSGPEDSLRARASIPREYEIRANGRP